MLLLSVMLLLFMILSLIDFILAGCVLISLFKGDGDELAHLLTLILFVANGSLILYSGISILY